MKTNKQILIGYRKEGINAFSVKQKGWKKYLGFGLFAYAVAPMLSFWAVVPAKMLLNPVSFKARKNLLVNDLNTWRRTR